VIGTNWVSDILFDQITGDELFERLRGSMYRLLNGVCGAPKFRLGVVVVSGYGGAW